jgi:O-antigen ligase
MGNDTEGTSSVMPMTETQPPKPLVVMPPILLGVLAVFLSLAWVIPNHTRPWATFYSDAIAGTVLLIVALWVLFRSPGKFKLIGLGLFFLLLATVPWLQFAAGLVYSSGTAWINSFYLLGLSLAIFSGWHWEKSTPGQCLDFLFLAIVIAAIVSVGIQLMQWFHLSSDPWVLGAGVSRFYANIGQPNLLASLLLMAVLGVAWGYAGTTLGPAIAIIFILCLLFGVALTESRTAWLNIAGILVALNFFWGESKPKFFVWILLGFGIYFIFLYFSLPAINELFFGKMTAGREAGDPIRVELWKSLLNAALERPWFGYGWGQTTEAVFSSRDLPDTGAMFRHAHNIVIELVIYNGILLGGLVLLVVGRTFHQFLANLNYEYFIIPFLAATLLVVHAMLEWPLHNAFFLLPFGMILGVLGCRSGVKVWCACPNWIGLGFTIVVAICLWITIADTLEAERTYFGYYYGSKGKAIPFEAIPQVKLLTQWEDRLRFANSTPEGGAVPREISMDERNCCHYARTLSPISVGSEPCT